MGSRPGTLDPVQPATPHALFSFFASPSLALFSSLMPHASAHPRRDALWIGSAPRIWLAWHLGGAHIPEEQSCAPPPSPPRRNRFFVIVARRAGTQVLRERARRGARNRCFGDESSW
jgi:hypothetical protein